MPLPLKKHLVKVLIVPKNIEKDFSLKLLGYHMPMATSAFTPVPAATEIVT